MIRYEQGIHDHWKKITDNGYVNVPSSGTVAYWLSHIEICHKIIDKLLYEINYQYNNSVDHEKTCADFPGNFCICGANRMKDFCEELIKIIDVKGE